ncbi:MAG: SBBP repeat-containing protein [Planctomycetota bacterium]
MYDAGGTLEYDLLVAPGADCRQVVVRCDGADRLEIDADGDLVASTALGTVRHKKPTTYSVSAAGARTPVASRFVLLGRDRFGFEVDGAASDALVIDPGLLYSTMIGAQGLDQGSGIGVDTEGFVYICGQTTSLHFPSTTDLVPGPDRTRRDIAQRFFKDDVDVFVTKLDLSKPPAEQIVYSTIIGGSDNDSPANVKIDAAGAAYVAGQTYSDDYPTTPGIYQGTRNGPYDLFVTKLDPSGAVLEYSTYLGGSGGDFAFGITVDAFGYAYLTGGTDSPDFPTTPGAFDSVPGADVNAFAAKLDTTATSLIYSTYIDGNGFDDGWDVQVNAAGEAFITGRSSSPDFPTTPGTFDSTWNGSLDTFVLELTADGSLIKYCTFVAALRRDEGHALAIDSSGIYVTGVARSEDFPVTPGAYDTSENDGYDAYAFKLDPTMSTLIYSTFLGGQGHDVAWDMGIDVLGQAYVTGVTYSPNFPTTVGSIGGFNGLSDAFISKFDATGSQLLYSACLGKGGTEEGISLAMGGALQNQVYLTGHTFSRFFPTTDNAYDRSWNGDYDAFVAWIDPVSSCEADSIEYGVGWPGTAGIPSLSVDKKPVICSDFSLLVGNSFGALTQAVIFIGLLPADVPTDFGGHLLVTPNILVSLPLSPGTNTLPLLYTCDSNLCGLITYLQVLEIDPGASNGIAFTPGLELLIGTE